MKSKRIGYVVASLGELGGGVSYTNYMTKKSYLEDNKAIQKSLNYVFTHSDSEVVEVITSYFPDTSMNDLTEEGFDRVQDTMDNSDKLEKKAPYKKLVNNE